MSRLAKKPIMIPEGTDVKIDGGTINVKGPKGELNRYFKNSYINIFKKDNEISLKIATRNKMAKALLGTYASHIKNMIEGVNKGFEKKLLIEGVGFKAQMDGKNLVLNLGFSHPVKYEVSGGVELSVEKNAIFVRGNDKEAVGQTASKIRSLKKPEPYKGKGIRYEGEIIRRKAGKKAAGAG